uniref:Protein kinase domain-containing protein n=1 Tax=Rhizochromulina marina TaxID=1034831 RepID=A0A7S2WLW3_9STRA
MSAPWGTAAAQPGEAEPGFELDFDQMFDGEALTEAAVEAAGQAVASASADPMSAQRDWDGAESVETAVAGDSDAVTLSAGQAGRHRSRGAVQVPGSPQRRAPVTEEARLEFQAATSLELLGNSALRGGRGGRGGGGGGGGGGGSGAGLAPLPPLRLGGLAAQGLDGGSGAEGGAGEPPATISLVDGKGIASLVAPAVSLGTGSDEKGPRAVAHPTLAPTPARGRLSPASRRRLPRTEDFELLCVIGMGAFGRVLQVRNRMDQEIYAMKVISKRVLRKKNSVGNMRVERDIMTAIDHPFIVKLKCCFSSEKKLFLVMEYMPGGELFFHLRKQGLLLEKTAQFYVAEILLALEHLHQKGIIHRDLKPENVLVSQDGHACLTDFGLAKHYSSPADDEPQAARTLCGTTEYMAPEMLLRKGYGKGVDFWSLGALMYEMMTGKAPFRGKTTKDIEQKILNDKVKFPQFFRSETVSIIKGLLERNVMKRLGATKSTMFEVGGVAALKQHKFFKGVHWDRLVKKQLPPPLDIEVATAEDTSNFDTEFTGMEIPGSLSEPSSPSKSKCGSPDWNGFSWVASGFEWEPQQLDDLDEEPTDRRVDRLLEEAGLPADEDQDPTSATTPSKPRAGSATGASLLRHLLSTEDTPTAKHASQAAVSAEDPPTPLDPAAAHTTPPLQDSPDLAALPAAPPPSAPLQRSSIPQPTEPLATPATPLVPPPTPTQNPTPPTTTRPPLSSSASSSPPPPNTRAQKGTHRSQQSQRNQQGQTRGKKQKQNQGQQSQKQKGGQQKPHRQAAHKQKEQRPQQQATPAPQHKAKGRKLNGDAQTWTPNPGASAFVPSFLKS